LLSPCYANASNCKLTSNFCFKGQENRESQERKKNEAKEEKPGKS